MTTTTDQPTPAQARPDGEPEAMAKAGFREIAPGHWVRPDEPVEPEKLAELASRFANRVRPEDVEPAKARPEMKSLVIGMGPGGEPRDNTAVVLRIGGETHILRQPFAGAFVELAESARAESTQQETLRRVREALGECVAELNEEIRNRYGNSISYPSEKRRFDRDMEAVVRGKEALAALDELMGRGV